MRPKLLLLLLSLIAFPASHCAAQDWVHTGTNLGVEKIRIAAADFKASSADPQTGPMKSAFDQTLYNDLRYAGIFDVVSKSFAPAGTPGSQQEINLSQWSAPPASAAVHGRQRRLRSSHCVVAAQRPA